MTTVQVGEEWVHSYQVGDTGRTLPPVTIRQIPPHYVYPDNKQER